MSKRIQLFGFMATTLALAVLMTFSPRLQFPRQTPRCRPPEQVQLHGQHQLVSDSKVGERGATEQLVPVANLESDASGQSVTIRSIRGVSKVFASQELRDLRPLRRIPSSADSSDPLA